MASFTIETRRLNEQGGMMNETFTSPAAKIRMTSVLLGPLLLLLCGCMQGTAGPGSTYRKGLQRDAWRTQEAYDQALLAHKEASRKEIPSIYWDPGIGKLQPVKVYTHHANLVVVQSVQNGMEHGLYLYLPTSRVRPKRTLLPKSGMDGFIFRESLKKDVFHFKRASGWHQALAE